MDFSSISTLPEKLKTEMLSFVNDYINKRWKPECILLFGSYCDNSYNRYSDVDLLILVSDECYDLLKGFKKHKDFYFSFIIINKNVCQSIISHQIRNCNRFLARIISKGIPIYNISDNIFLLKYIAKEHLNIPFPPVHKDSLYKDFYDILQLKNKYIAREHSNVFTELIGYQIITNSFNLFIKLHRYEQSSIDFFEKNNFQNESAFSFFSLCEKTMQLTNKKDKDVAFLNIIHFFKCVLDVDDDFLEMNIL